MDREIELKFLLPPEAAGLALAELKAVQDGEGAVRQLDATYFDTPDHALRRAGYGLRVRDGEGGRKQTLKSASAGGVFSRGEWETVVDGPEPDRDALALTPAAAMLEDRPLAPVFTTHVERVVRLVQIDEAVIETALDRGELSAADRRAPVCELELELKAGPPRALFDLARTLAARVPLRLSLVSKAERGYDLAAGEDGPPPRRHATALSPKATVGEALQALGRADLGHLCAALEALRERPEAEAVHQARVATRRLRALLKIFKPLAKDEAARRLDEELSWLAGEFDAARDLDVFVDEIWRDAAPGAEFTGKDAFERGLQAVHANAYLRMEAALESPRARAVLLEAAAWLEAGDWATAPELAEIRDGAAKAYAAEVLHDRRKAVKKRAKRFDDLDAEARHRLRLKGKTLRYAAEDLAPLFPEHAERADRFVKAAKAAQDTLGALNDRSVREGLVDLAAHGDADLSRAAQRVVLGDEEHDLVAAARAALKDLIEAKTFW
ncbi:inorganic triphosphatase [Caulobacter segnis]|uniref:CHAD domain containing protein n=2 Tax=Caulobacter segnis TaxID=88688 RepID=D5VDY7_CAUST|nr:inorganic triphosphatase [Caulobacter segnis]ADG08687.1 CHAD domain containing protein [Caulobacter segnis ATCC 21756]AVQ04254.1 inorganic triphosphatase [Caulobacter segnis]